MVRKLRILITGGFGFIGSALIRYLLNHSHFEIGNVDCATYAANLDQREVFERAGVKNYIIDVQSKEMERVFEDFRPDKIINLAAETHVDRSIHSPGIFLKTNVIGTYNLLQSAHKYWKSGRCNAAEKFLFLHVSTDEIYGSLGVNDEKSRENDPIHPSSPYSASKASSDCFVNAWNVTYGLPTMITNCTNNYGPFQADEKLIPKVVKNALQNKEIPIFGNGKNVRDWLFVDDHVDALMKLTECGKVGERYNIGGNTEVENIQLVKMILAKISSKTGKSYEDFIKLIRFVDDRAGHDTRYALNTEKIKRQVAWQPKTQLDAGLDITIDWYMKNGR